MQAERDFKALPASTPTWKGNLPLGHGGDLFSNDGGKFGRAGIAWLEYYFKGVGALTVGWFHKSIDDYIVTGQVVGLIPGGLDNGYDGEYE